MQQKQYKASPLAVRLMQGLTFLSGGAFCLLITQIAEYRIVLILSAGFLLLWILAGFFYIPAYLRRIRISISHTEITVQSGVFFSRTRTILLQSLLLNTLLTTFLSRYTGLNFILLHTYGGTLLLPFLQKQDAEALHGILNTYLLTAISKEEPHAP